jgi:hypothetical protein
LERFQKYENPGVPIVLYYNISWTTFNKFTYHKSPAEERAKRVAKGDLTHWTDHDAIVPDISEPLRGDVAVTAAGQLLPYLKWADDFDRSAKKDSKKYPVKFVDYCSQVQNRNTPFDDFQGDTYETATEW